MFLSWEEEWLLPDRLADLRYYTSLSCSDSSHQPGLSSIQSATQINLLIQTPLISLSEGNTASTAISFTEIPMCSLHVTAGLTCRGLSPCWELSHMTGKTRKTERRGAQRNTQTMWRKDERQRGEEECSGWLCYIKEEFCAKITHRANLTGIHQQPNAWDATKIIYQIQGEEGRKEGWITEEGGETSEAKPRVKLRDEATFFN